MFGIKLLLISLTMHFAIEASTQSISPIAFRGGHIHLSSSTTLFQLLTEIGICDDCEEILQLCESIPAIMNCDDKSMRISYSETSDAVLAMHAIYRIANLTVNGVQKHLHDELDSDRRFLQLTECVDLCVGTLQISDLVQYVWSMSVLGIVDETQITQILSEFANRLLDPSTKLTEKGIMVWAIGCAKHTMGIVNHSLMNDSLSTLKEALYYNDGTEVGTASTSLVGVLWAMAVYGKNDPEVVSTILSLTVSDLEKQSTINIITLVWSCSIFRYIENNQLLPQILHEMRERVSKKQLQRSDYSIISDSLRAIFYDQVSNKVHNHTVLNFSDFAGDVVPEYLPYWSSIANETRSTMKLVTENALKSNFTLLSANAVTSMFRAASAMAVCSGALLDATLGYITGLLAANKTLSAPQSAAVLASLGIMQSRMCLDPATLPPLASSNGSVPSFEVLDQSALRHRLVIPRWRRIAGRLGAICATALQQHRMVSSSNSISSTPTQLLHSQINSAGHLHSLPPSQMLSVSLLDRIQLLNACWGIAELGHQYRGLLRAVRKSVQFSLHELDAQSLARLAVAVAEEECGVTVGKEKGISGAKLDREFVDQAMLMALRNIREMTPREQIGCLVAVAKLGRMSGVGWRDAMGDGEPVDLMSGTIASLSTNELITLFWALGRVSTGVVSEESLTRVLSSLHERDLGPTAISTDDVLVLMRTLRTASSNKLDAFESAHKVVSSALLNHLNVWVRLSEGKPVQEELQEGFIDRYLYDNSQHKKNPPLVHSMFSSQEKCEILLALIDLKWFDKELLQLTDYMKVQVDRLIDIESNLTTDQAFDLGRLEELLKIYETVPDAHQSNHRYYLGKKILSRFFHGIPGWRKKYSS